MGALVSALTTSAPATCGARPFNGDGFDLDVRIVEAGPAAAMMPGNTDDGCDTVRGSDC